MFTGDWKKAWEGVKSIFNGIFNGVASIVEGVINVIINMLNSFLRKFNGVITKIGDVIGVDIAIPEIPNVKLPKLNAIAASTPYAANPAFAALSSAPIPKLATGAVIPANREFLAVLGDQKHGTNIEAPLEMIKQANKEGFLEVLSELGLTGGSNSGGTVKIEIPVILNGNEIGRAVQQFDREFFKQNNRHAFT